MNKKNILYCAHCGTSHGYRKKKCSQCGKKLPIKDQLLWDYLKDHIKDEWKGKVTDSVFSILKNYLLSHLYGTILTGVILLSVASVVTTRGNQPRYEIVREKPNVLQEEIAVKSEFERFQESFITSLINNDSATLRNYYLEFQGVDFPFAVYHEVWNQPHLFANRKNTFIVAEPTCTTKQSQLEDNSIFSDLVSAGYSPTECLYHFNYCQDNTCSSTKNYDFVVPIVIQFVKYNNTWYAVDETILLDNQKSQIFYDAQGDISQIVSRSE